MERKALRTELRRDYLDDATPPYLYEDDALNGFLNDAQRQVCLRKRALIDSTSTVTQFELPIGAQRVRLNPAILAVRFARLNDCHPLTGTTAKRLLKRDPDWDMSDPGSPRYWVPDYQEGFLYFDRPTDIARTLKLSVWRMPLEAEQMEDDGDSPIIAEHYHQDLLDWAAYRAFSMKDSELGDEKRAATHLQTFEAKVGRLPNMTEVRLWGIQPVVGVPAEFI
ncbi:DUF6682 family protein [Luteimonas saliphila]|uniref:phage adaptor protein n=1 Tax=Luteimonas saliphila TaxID=2804919 RepID=UPI00192DCB01|nr:DUF6682 family protein [Luteimonas saliphila]